MAIISKTTTPAQDAAILDLGSDASVQAFADRILDHQIAYALSLQPTIADKFNAADSATQAQIVDLLKNVPLPKKGATP